MEEWEKLGFELVIYPVSSLRVAAATMKDFKACSRRLSVAIQRKMMTRAELYEVIDYQRYEELENYCQKHSTHAD